MRILVFLLVAANLAFFAWTQGYLGQRENPDAVRLTQQLEAERLAVLSRDEPPAPKVPPATKKTVVEKCVAWTGLVEAEASQVDALLAEKFAGLRRARHVVPEISSWWVFIPPQTSKAEADKKAGELKRLGAPEFFVVQDAGPNRWAISLGIFSSEQAANERLESLKAKNVKTAKVGKRATSRPEQVSIEASGAEPMIDAARDALGAQMPALSASTCGKN